jgi:recombinational DNA repair protein RecR
MIGLAPEVGLVVTTGVAAAMIRLGLDKGLLRQRRETRRCPSCGRLIDSRVCRVCTGRTR